MKLLKCSKAKILKQPRIYKMNGIQPLESSAITTFEPLIGSLLNNNFPTIAAYFFAAFGGAFSLDTLTHKKCELKNGTSNSIITRVAVVTVSILTGAYFAPQFDLKRIPETALKIQEVVNGLAIFKMIASFGTALTLFQASKLKARKTTYCASTIVMSFLFASSVYPQSWTLFASTTLGSYLGLCASYAAAKPRVRKIES